MAIQRNRLKPIRGEISPAGILAFDQLQFLFSGTGLDLFLALDGKSDISKFCKIDQAIESILSGEAGQYFVLMLPDSLAQIACYPRVEGAVTLIGYDIDVIHIVPDLSLRGAKRRSNPEYESSWIATAGCAGLAMTGLNKKEA